VSTPTTKEDLVPESKGHDTLITVHQNRVLNSGSCISHQVFLTAFPSLASTARCVHSMSQYTVAARWLTGLVKKAPHKHEGSIQALRSEA
jgi:hypothetical protein